MQNNKKLRVGYVSPGWPLSSYPNGIVAYVENILGGLDSEIKPVILSLSMHEPEIEGLTINIAKYNNRHSNFPTNILAKLLSILKYNNTELMQYKNFLRDSGRMLRSALQNLEEPLDILEMEESFGLNYYAINRSKTRYVTRLHGPWFTLGKIFNLEKDGQFKLRVFYEGEAIKNSHGVTAPSLDVLEKVREYYNLELPYAKVIPNPIPLVDKDKQWQLVEENPYILFVGRFDSHKGGDLIIDSFNIIAQTDKNIKLYVVGPDRGFVVNGVQFNINEYIAKNIQDESIRKRIKFHGHCSSDQISVMRQKARVTVFCSRYETFGISLLEALAVGCPTVATAVGGIKEIVIDNYNGLLAEPESIDSIAEKVLILLNDNKKSQLLSKNAIQDAIKRFSPKDIAEQSVDYYKSVISRY
jgi:glycosyltransferase involved in cell wall biosynthesis